MILADVFLALADTVRYQDCGGCNALLKSVAACAAAAFNSASPSDDGPAQYWSRVTAPYDPDLPQDAAQDATQDAAQDATQDAAQDAGGDRNGGAQDLLQDAPPDAPPDAPQDAGVGRYGGAQDLDEVVDVERNTRPRDRLLAGFLAVHATGNRIALPYALQRVRAQSCLAIASKQLVTRWTAACANCGFVPTSDCKEPDFAPLCLCGGGCGTAYCSESCQRDHWKRPDGHANDTCRMRWKLRVARRIRKQSTRLRKESAKRSLNL